MGIFSRMSDIVNSNLNALLDKAENPKKMVRLMIQEMEDTLVEVRTASARVIAEKKELSRKIEWLLVQQNDWQQKAELALEKDRDDLAKAALVEKNKITDTINGLNKEKDANVSALAKLNEDVAQLQQKLADAKARQESILARHRTVESRLQVRKQLASDTVSEAFSRFEQYELKMDAMEAEVESFDLGQSKSLNEQFIELESQDKIEKQLADLKERLSKKQPDGE